SGIDDDLDDGDQDWDVTVSIDDAASDDAWDSLDDQEINGTTTDDDTSGFTASYLTTAIDVSEAGSTLDLSVVLEAKPTADVTISMTGHDASEIQPGAAITFTPANWNIAQTFTVTGVDDDLDDGDQNTTASLEASSTDSAYDGLDRMVFFTTTDDDTAGITLTGTSVTVSEAGTTGSVSVVLDSQPTADVTFTISGSDASEASVDPTVLTFTTVNWKVAQAVSVTGMDDPATDGPQASTVTLSPASSDSAYDAMADLVVDVTTTDDDTAGVTVSQDGGSTVVSEAGTTDVVSVVLNTQPTSDVTITVALSGSDEASSDVAELTFTDT
ncbi:MAG: calcium-binding protein, partial [Verrucomicrobiaceae bacterium]|nr:calcium-binding protein [Verrucomicrobiaceae bacterium]